MASSYTQYHAEPRMKAAGAKSDEKLMVLLAGGDDEALAVLVERYQNDVFRFCLHYLKNVELAKESAQETFLRVFTARERFDEKRTFKPWMLCIARNLCLNQLKRKKTVTMETLEDYASASREDTGELVSSAEESPAEQLMLKERHQALLGALNKLPDDAREIVVMRYFEKMSARDIADVVDSTEGAVRTRLYRALKQLRGKCEHLREEV